MASIFTKIINRELPGYILEEDRHNIAFLDIQPLKKGHTLVVPKQEVDYIFDLEDDTYISLQRFAHKIAHRLKKIIPCVRIGVAVVGLEVPHVHIHLIPIDRISDINFANPKLKLNPDEFSEIVKKYRNPN